MYTPPKKKGPRTNKPQVAGKMRLRTGDLVRVIAGKDKGKEGTVTRVLTDEGKVVVEGINIIIKHQKAPPQRQQNVIGGATPQGGRIEQSAPMPACKVQLVDPADSSHVSRIGVGVDAEGNKTRVARKSGSVIDNG